MTDLLIEAGQTERPTIYHGAVVEVAWERAGVSVTADAAAGSTVLVFDSGIDVGQTYVFDDGDTVLVDAVSTDYLTATLHAPISVAKVIGDFAVLQPVQIEQYAYVQLDDADDDPVVCLVPYGMTLDEGPRDVQQERVAVEQLPDEHFGQWMLRNVLGIDYVSTIPVPPKTDGHAPTSSPTPTVYPGISSLALAWPPVVNADPVVYEIHVQPQVGGTLSTVASMAGTTVSLVRDGDGNALIPNVPYNCWIVAKDADGAGPVGTVVVGIPRQITDTSGDIAVGAITADTIATGAITAEKLASVLILASTLIAGDQNGQRVVIDQSGITLIDASGSPTVSFPTDPNQDAWFHGRLEATALEVLQSLVIRGTNNIFNPGSIVTLRTTQPAPQVKPTVKTGWQQTTIQPPGVAYRGIGWYAAGSSWLVAETQQDDSGIVSWVLREHRASDLTVVRTFGTNAQWGLVQGVAVGSAAVFVLSQFLNTITMTKFSLATGAQLGQADISSSILMQSNGSPVAVAMGNNTNANLLLMDAASVDEVAWTWRPRVRVFTWPGAPPNLPILGSPLNLTGRDLDLFGDSVAVVGAESNYWVAMANDRFFGADTLPWLQSSGAAVGNQDFPFPSDPGGLCHDGVQFWSLVGGTLTMHTNWNWTTESNKYWVGQTWWEDVT